MLTALRLPSFHRHWPAARFLTALAELEIAERETRSLAIAANQPFSARDRIFFDKAVTVAAIDRLVPTRQSSR